MADTELCYLPATEVMKRFRDHTLRPSNTSTPSSHATGGRALDQRHDLLVS